MTVSEVKEREQIMTDYPDSSVQGFAHSCIFGRIHGTIVTRTRPARFMEERDGLIPDMLRPPSDGERVILAGVSADDLASVDDYWRDLYDFSQETCTGINSWDCAVDVQMVDIRTGECAVGYVERIESESNGTLTVEVFLPDPRPRTVALSVDAPPTADELSGSRVDEQR